MLKFEDVSFSIGKNEILRELNFEISPMELVAVLGRSGAGKSSLFRLLIGDSFPTKGTIKLDDLSLENISYKSLQNYRQQVGVVFQDFRLLRGKTAYENIAFALEVCGKEELIARRVPELLEIVGLSGKKDFFPRELSGGENQRIAIARSLVHDPKILIADEATGNLDPKSSREVADIFAQINKKKGITILFATHDPVLVKQLNPRVIRLEEGKIQFDRKGGGVEEVFEGIL